MKHYLQNGVVWAFESDGSQDSLISPGMVVLSETDLASLRKPAIPAVVSMRQARLALLSSGKLAGVDAAIASLPSPQREAARIEWEYAATVERSSQLTALLGASLGLDSVALDALFTSAAGL